MQILYLAAGENSSSQNLPQAWPDRLFGGEQGREVGRHEVITFGYAPDVDIQIPLSAPFSEVLDQLPEGWVPDVCVCVHVDFLMIPPGIEDAPFPTVAVTADWDYRIGVIRSVVRAFDLVIGLGDASCRALQALGARRTLPFAYFGFPEPWMAEDPAPIDNDRPIDVLFTGTIADHTHRDRSQWLARLARLADRYHIHIDDSTQPHDAYIELLRRTRFVFTFHRRGELQLRFTDAVVEGACPLDNGVETARHFDPETEYALYDDDDFEAQVVRHLANEPLRRQKVAAARQKVLTRFGSVQRIAGLFDAIEQELPNLDRDARTARRVPDGEVNRRSAEILYLDHFDRWLGLRTDYLPTAIRLAERAEPGPRQRNDLAVILTSQSFQGAEPKEGERALLLFESLTRESPRYAMGWFNRAYALEVHQQAAEAATCYERAYELLMDPEAGDFDLDALYCREQDYQLQGFKKPLLDARLRIALGASDAQARQILAANCAYVVSRHRRREGRLHEALQMLDIAGQLDPANSAVARDAARLADLLGENAEAARHHRRLLDLHPLDILIRLNAASFFARQRQEADAIRIVQAAIPLVTAIKSNIPLSDQVQATADALSIGESGLQAIEDLPFDRFATEAIAELYGSMGARPDPRIVARVHELLVAQGKHDAAKQWHQHYDLETKRPILSRTVSASRT